MILKMVFLLFLVPCGVFAQAPKLSAELKSVRAAENAEALELAQSFQKVCEQKSILKKEPVFSANVCSCMVRNHRGKLSLNEMKSILRYYKAAPNRVRARDVSESELWEYDLKLAQECVKNTEFEVAPEE